MAVKMMAKLPKNASDNGLTAIEEQLIHDLDEGAEETWLVVGVVKAKRYTVEDDGTRQPTAHFMMIEVLQGPERGTGELLLRNRRSQRTGEATLPFEAPAGAIGPGAGEDDQTGDAGPGED